MTPGILYAGAVLLMFFAGCAWVADADRKAARDEAGRLRNGTSELHLHQKAKRMGMEYGA